MADKEKIGVVGTGRMGQAMVRHLIKHGYAVVAQDIEPKAVEAARGLGAETAKTPAEVGRACKFVIVAVGYDDEATAVMLGQGGLLETMGAGSVIGVSSTCTPEHVKMLAEKARAKGVEVLDAPICRGQMAADTGTMLILCGGKPEVFERGKPIYSTFGKDYRAAGRHRRRPVRQGDEQFPALGERHRADRGRPAREANGMDLVKLREALLISRARPTR